MWPSERRQLREKAEEMIRKFDPARHSMPDLGLAFLKDTVREMREQERRGEISFQAGWYRAVDRDYSLWAESAGADYNADAARNVLA